MKTVIVTGISGNLGLAVAKKFLAEGYHVVGTVLHADKAPLIDGIKTIVADLGDEARAGQIVESVIAQNGNIDAAVLTVGGFAMGKISGTSISDIEKQYKLNFETAYNIARPVFLQMLKQGSGRIFFIGSRTGLDPKKGKGSVGYSLAKSLLFRLAEIMNEEAKGTNVVACVVAPSTIDTPQNRQAMPEANFEDWVAAGEIADIIHFYCTTEGSKLREPVLKIYGNS